ncbi:hypothetical protein MICRO116_130011 [Micrococcus sp. 116]|nr:hypothetical protein MICRO116_130011 [Micrococcus sp. 116]
MLLPLLEQLRVTRPVGRPRTRPEAVLGDKAYSSRAIRTHLRSGHPRTGRPAGPPQTARCPRRAPRQPRRGRLQGPQRHRASVRAPEAVAGSGDPV